MRGASGREIGTNAGVLRQKAAEPLLITFIRTANQIIDLCSVAYNTRSIGRPLVRRPGGGILCVRVCVMAGERSALHVK